MDSSGTGSFLQESVGHGEVLLCSWHVLGYIWFIRPSRHEVGDFSYLNSLFGMGNMGPVTGTFCENSFTVLEPNLLLSR